MKWKTKPADHTLCETVKSKRMSWSHKGHFIRKFTWKMPRTRTHTLREPAQSKRMSRFHTRRFLRKFTGNRSQKRVTTLIKHQPSHLPSEPLSVDTLSGEECFYILCQINSDLQSNILSNTHIFPLTHISSFITYFVYHFSTFYLTYMLST